MHIDKINSVINAILDNFTTQIIEGDFEYITFDILVLEIKEFLLKENTDDLIKNELFLNGLNKMVKQYFSEKFIGFKFWNQIDEAFALYFYSTPDYNECKKLITR